MNWRVVHCSDPERLDARNFDPGVADLPDIRHDGGMAHTATHTAQEHIMTSTTKTIRCGNCKGTHGSVQEVRDCHAGVRHNRGLEGQILSATNGSITEADVAYARTASSPQRTSGVVATEKQVAFLRSLILERPMWAEVENLHEGMLESLTKAEASHWIKQALATPKETGAAKAQPTKDAFEDVPAGYYAVTSLSGANDLDFYSVDRPTEGKWAGYVFVKQVVGGKPEFPVKGAKWAKVLKAIQDAGWQDAARLYGQEIGRCGKCNRTLTDETSRQLGVGPVCRGQGF